MKYLPAIFASLLLCFSTQTIAQKKTSATTNSVVFADLPYQDVACPDGAYVTGMDYRPSSNTATIKLTCRNFISNTANAPSTSPNSSLCQPCIASPRGARKINNAQTTTQAQCVYNEFPGQVCP